MLAYCGRPISAAFCDAFPYIDPRYVRETIAETCSIWVALATAIISQTGFQPLIDFFSFCVNASVRGRPFLNQSKHTICPAGNP
jgi:hypothetical protein